MPSSSLMYLGLTPSDVFIAFSFEKSEDSKALNNQPLLPPSKFNPL
ncbi:hypothetical protein [Staphylococcus haemolyticus]